MLLPLVFILIACYALLRTTAATMSAMSAMSASDRINDHFSMVLVGGGLLDDNDEVWNKIIELGKK